MPVKLTRLPGGKVRVSTDHVHAKATTMAKAKAQERLLNAVEHTNWKPTGQKARSSKPHKTRGRRR